MSGLLFGLKSSDIDAIQAILKTHPNVDQVHIYGSRAKGNFKPGSDIDLCLFGSKLDLSELLQIDQEIDDLLLPYKCDLSLFDAIDHQSLKTHILDAGQLFYEKRALTVPSDGKS